MLLAVVLVAGHHVALDVRGERAAHAHFGRVAVEVQTVLRIELLVGHAGHQVGGRGDAVVVADTHLPLVHVIAAALGFLRVVVAKDMEVRRHRDRALHGPAIRVATLGIGVHVAAFNIVVRQTVGCRGSERQCSEQAQGKQRSLHIGTHLSLFLVLPAAPLGEGRERAVDRC
ncbi:hypothetical protein D3C72_1590560 [compost metagenome]